MIRGALLLLCAFLAGWVPLDFAVELLSALSSLGIRGPGAWIEILVDAAVAAASVAAAWALWSGNPGGVPLSRWALVALAVTGIQSQYWSSLPHQTVPAHRPVFAGLMVLNSAAWLLFLAWYRRRPEPTSGARR